MPLDDDILRPILSSPVEAFCIAAARALSSSAFVLPVLKQKGWEERADGTAAEGTAAAELRGLGQDVERQVMLRAVRWHLEDRVIVDGNKTVVFVK